MTQNPIPQALWSYLQSKYKATDARIVKGGSINEAAKIITDSQSFFIKWNQDFIPGFFESEVSNLELISKTSTVKTPDIVEYGMTEDAAFLIMEYLQPGFHTYQSMQKLGEQLAQMHMQKSGFIGLDYNNYCGLLPQYNARSNSWEDFFLEYRLKPLVNKAFSQNLLTLDEVARFVKLFTLFPNLFPVEQTCLLHGDLWSGNFIITENQQPYLIDPACYHGHREVDIAMTLLFGGFDKAFYDAYTANYPLEEGWKERSALWNLYPLLVHLILFGGSYRKQLVDQLTAIAA
jgi:fructosamine-3-kinase